MTSHQHDGVKATSESRRCTISELPERLRYTLADLLAQCDAELNDDDNEWLIAPPVGRELM